MNEYVLCVLTMEKIVMLHQLMPREVSMDMNLDVLDKRALSLQKEEKML